MTGDGSLGCAGMRGAAVTRVLHRDAARGGLGTTGTRRAARERGQRGGTRDSGPRGGPGGPVRERSGEGSGAVRPDSRRSPVAGAPLPGDPARTGGVLPPLLRSRRAARFGARAQPLLLRVRPGRPETPLSPAVGGLGLALYLCQGHTNAMGFKIRDTCGGTKCACGTSAKWPDCPLVLDRPVDERAESRLQQIEGYADALAVSRHVCPVRPGRIEADERLAHRAVSSSDPAPFASGTGCSRRRPAPGPRSGSPRPPPRS